MSEFKDILKELRLNKKMTQGQLAKELQISKSSVGMYEIGQRKPDIETLKMFAKYFKTDIDYLVNGKSSSSAVTKELIEHFPNIHQITLKKVPMLGSISCGEPVFADEYKDTFIEVGNDLHVDFCLKAAGDSMIGARIHDGDFVYIRSQSMVENGEIAAVIVGDEALLKRVYIYPNKIILNPENPKYEPLIFINEELNNVRILGKAVAFQSIIR